MRRKGRPRRFIELHFGLEHYVDLRTRFDIRSRLDKINEKGKGERGREEGGERGEEGGRGRGGRGREKEKSFTLHPLDTSSCFHLALTGESELVSRRVMFVNETTVPDLGK